MYERILVPLDGSRFSEEVIPYASGLAAAHDTELVLLRVLENESEEREATPYVNRLAAAHAAIGRCVLRPGDAASAVLEEARRQPDTLLAMTSRGHSGLMELALGSVAQRVLRGAGGPVLVYHPTGKPERKRASVRPQRVVLPLDGSPFAEAMAHDAGRFAHWLGAPLEVVSVVEPVTAAEIGDVSGSGMADMESGYVRTQAQQIGKRYAVRSSWETLHGDPAKAIAEHVAGSGDAILVMATRRKSALQAALLGSVTAACLHRAGVPILMRTP